MSKIQLSIEEITLQKLNFINGIDEKKTESSERSSHIKWNSLKDGKVEFVIDFTYSKRNFKIEGSYLFVITHENVKNIDEFIEREQEKIVLPVFAKISNNISHLTDQIMPFPVIIPATAWLTKMD